MADEWKLDATIECSELSDMHTEKNECVYDFTLLSVELKMNLVSNVEIFRIDL